MKVGDLYKNYNEKNGLFTYEILEIKNDTILMKLHYPDFWNVPFYVTKFTKFSAEINLTPIK